MGGWHHEEHLAEILLVILTKFMVYIRYMLLGSLFQRLVSVAATQRMTQSSAIEKGRSPFLKFSFPQVFASFLKTIIF